MAKPKIRYASGTASAGLQQFVEGIIESRYGRVIRGRDVVTVAEVDLAGGVLYWQRVGDLASHNAYPTRWLPGYSPSVGDTVVIEWIDRVPHCVGKLS